MGRNPCCAKDGLNKGAWSSQEDQILIDYVKKHGEGKWSTVAQKTGLKRSGKSCRLRWLNYLRPDLKRGDISPDEEDLIIRLHNLLGNRWALIAGRLPGRTDNEIKNYWNTNLAKKPHGQTSKSSIKPLNPEEKQPNYEEFEVGIPQLTSTKDVSCNRTLIPPEQNQPTIGNKNLIYEGERAPSSTRSEDASLNFLMDIDINDSLIPEVLCSDSSLMHENGDMASYNYNITSSFSECPFSEYEGLLENEMIRSNPLQPTLYLELNKVASFLDLED